MCLYQARPLRTYTHFSKSNLASSVWNRNTLLCADRGWLLTAWFWSQDKAQLILRSSVKELLKRLTAATNAALAMSDADLEYERVHAGPLDGRFVSTIDYNNASHISP